MAPCLISPMYALRSSGNSSYGRAVLKQSFSCLGIPVNTGAVSVFPPPSHAGNLTDKEFCHQIFPSVDKVLSGGRSSNAVSCSR